MRLYANTRSKEQLSPRKVRTIGHLSGMIDLYKYTFLINGRGNDRSSMIVARDSLLRSISGLQSSVPSRHPYVCAQIPGK